MHAWWCEALDGLDGLQWREGPEPVPGPGQVLLAVEAASVNFPDLLMLEGKYQVRPPLPFVPGSEYCGTVQVLGEGVQRLRIGDRVAVIGSHGGFATHSAVAANQCIPLPAGMPREHGAAFLFTYGTSWHALMDRARLRAGDTVLVLGAAGGVGSAAVQIARAAGSRVIAAASTDDKCAWCRELGADVTINTSTHDLRAALKAATEGRGVDVVYDPVGGDLAEPAFRSIAWRGRYLVVGFAAGQIPSFPLNLALLKGADIVGVFWGDHMRREPAEFALSVQRLYEGYAAGRLVPALHRVRPIAEVPAALREMANRNVRGKMVLVNG